MITSPRWCSWRQNETKLRIQKRHGNYIPRENANKKRLFDEKKKDATWGCKSSEGGKDCLLERRSCWDGEMICKLAWSLASLHLHVHTQGRVPAYNQSEQKLRVEQKRAAACAAQEQVKHSFYHSYAVCTTRQVECNRIYMRSSHGGQSSTTYINWEWFGRSVKT